MKIELSDSKNNYCGNKREDFQKEKRCFKE